MRTGSPPDVAAVVIRIRPYSGAAVPRSGTVRVVAQTKRPPEGRSFDRAMRMRSGQTQRPVLPPISEEAHAQEAEDHHGPGRRLGHGRNTGHPYERILSG
jgi:hypothetical protein